MTSTNVSLLLDLLHDKGGTFSPGVSGQGSGGWFQGEHPIHQPRHRPHPRRVVLPEVPVRMRQGLEPPQPTNAMLHHDPPPTERLVVTPIGQRPRLPPRLAPPRRPQ